MREKICINAEASCVKMYLYHLLVTSCIDDSLALKIDWLSSFGVFDRSLTIK
jgi:hypothetical protein